MRYKLLLTALITAFMVSGASANLNRGIEAYKQPTVEVNDLTGEIIGTVYLENTGDKMEERYLVEMQILTEDSEFLSFVGSEQVCDPDSKENVHRDFVLEPGEKEEIQLTSQVPKSSTYDIKFWTTTGCMVGPDEEPDAHLIEPYSGGYKVDDVEVGKTLPVGMNELKLLGALFVALIVGGVAYTRE